MNRSGSQVPALEIVVEFEGGGGGIRGSSQVLALETVVEFEGAGGGIRRRRKAVRCQLLVLTAGSKSMKKGWSVEGEDGGRPCLYRSSKGASAG